MGEGVFVCRFERSMGRRVQGMFQSGNSNPPRPSEGEIRGENPPESPHIEPLNLDSRKWLQINGSVSRFIGRVLCVVHLADHSVTGAQLLQRRRPDELFKLGIDRLIGQRLLPRLGDPKNRSP